MSFRTATLVVALVPIAVAFLATGDSVTLAPSDPVVGVRQASAVVTGADQSLFPTSASPAADSAGRQSAASASGSVPEPPPPPPVWSGGAGTYAGGGGGSSGGALAVSTQQVLINSDRSGAGLGPLAWNGCLAGVAAQNAQRMAAAGAISHADGPSRNLGCGLGSAQAGENVGYWSGGINDGQLNSMFMASPGHRSNIMGPYRYVGTAWVVAPNGHAYIAVEFA
jgi:uncharacterized protein YkwD